MRGQPRRPYQGSSQYSHGRRTYHSAHLGNFRGPLCSRVFDARDSSCFCQLKTRPFPVPQRRAGGLPHHHRRALRGPRPPGLLRRRQPPSPARRLSRPPRRDQRRHRCRLPQPAPRPPRHRLRRPWGAASSRRCQSQRPRHRRAAPLPPRLNPNPADSLRVLQVPRPAARPDGKLHRAFPRRQPGRSTPPPGPIGDHRSPRGDHCAGFGWRVERAGQR